MNRHFGLDWLRIGAFALLIFYHIGMVFVPWDFHIKTAQPQHWLELPMLALNPWRLPLLFVVSGYATRALASRMPSAGALVGSRSHRLLLPLFFGVALVVPPQSWVQLTVKNGYVDSFVHFWLHDYFRFGTLDGVILPTWNHLWFVLYLWIYTMLLAAGMAVVGKSGARIQSAFDRLATPAAMLAVPILWLIVGRMVLFPIFGETHALFDDWDAHSVYAPAFLVGFGFAGDAMLWRKIARVRVPAILAALVGGLVFLGIEGVLEGQDWSAGVIVVARLARSTFAWGTIISLLAFADAVLNRDHRWRAMLTEAVFPFYIIHQTIIIVVEFWLRPAQLPAAAEFVILVIATVAGCWAFYRFGRRIGWLRPLIGLSSKASHRAEIRLAKA